MSKGLDMTQVQPKAGFNLSKWALDHPALTRYLLVVLMLLGFAAYFQLGQDEDPPFTFRAMVVHTNWPGATAQQVAEQVTDKQIRAKVLSLLGSSASKAAQTIMDLGKAGDYLALDWLEDAIRYARSIRSGA